MRYLVTRPRDDAEAFAKTLYERGHVAIVAPVMEVHVIAGEPIALEGVQAVLATSANGVRALAARTKRRDVTLYAVGPQTAEAARDAGFPIVISAEGDSAALVETVAREADPAKGLLFHAAGAETAGRLRQALLSRGFRIETARDCGRRIPVLAAQRQNLCGPCRGCRLGGTMCKTDRVLHQRRHRRSAEPFELREDGGCRHTQSGRHSRPHRPAGRGPTNSLKESDAVTVPHENNVL